MLLERIDFLCHELLGVQFVQLFIADGDIGVPALPISIHAIESF